MNGELRRLRFFVVLRTDHPAHLPVNFCVTEQQIVEFFELDRLDQAALAIASHLQIDGSTFLAISGQNYEHDN